MITRCLAVLPLMLSAMTAKADLDGVVSSVGSDTLVEVMAAWGERLQFTHPGVEIHLLAEGSEDAPIALIAGQSNVAPMSREMTERELEAFEAAHGHRPTRFRVGMDAIAIYAHEKNPINGLTMDQLDAIFSTTRACASGWFADRNAIDDWSQLSHADRGAIRLYGRNARSGTYATFHDAVLCGGEFRDNVAELPDSGSVVEAVARDRHGIGYAGISSRTEGVKTLALSPRSTFFESAYYSHIVEKFRNDPDLEKRYGWVVRDRYPLSRYLFLYVDDHPDGGIDPVVKAYVAVALSEEGQSIAHELGYIPLPRKVLKVERRTLEAIE